MGSLKFLWAEITGKCELECVHCYADSGPRGTHGAMSADDWVSVIDEAATLGVHMVQFIGGEPTLYPHLTKLIDYALSRGIEVEVFTNLVHVTTAMWATGTAQPTSRKPSPVRFRFASVSSGYSQDSAPRKHVLNSLPSV